MSLASRNPERDIHLNKAWSVRLCLRLHLGIDVNRQSTTHVPKKEQAERIYHGSI